MLQGRVEALRAAVAAFNRRDGEAFGAVLPRTLRSRRCGRPSTGRFTGARMLARRIAPLSRRFGKTSDGSRGAPRRRRLGACLGTYEGRDATAGSTSTRGRAAVARFRKGQVTNFHTYTDRADASDAVGLSE